MSSLTVGTEYSFQIRAVNNAVKGAMSDTASATPVTATVGFENAILTSMENTNLTVTLVLSQAVSADVDIYLTSTDFTATKGSDYAAGTVTSPDSTTGTYEVTITAGQTEGSTTIAISDDTIPEENELFFLVIHEIASTVAIARGTTARSDVIIRDDTDTAIALPDPATLTVTEASGSTRTGSYNVALQVEVAEIETVTVAVASQDASVATVTPASLTFTADDWNTGKTVTVTAVDDEIDQDTDRTVAIRHTAASDIPSSLYTGRDPADLIVTVTDDDVTAAGVTTAQPTDKAVDEADQTDTATFTVVLNTEPTAPVRVSLTPATGLALSTNGTTWGTSLQLDFATGAWSTAQTAMVRAATDSVDSPSARELAVTYAATSSDTDYSGLNGTAATVTVADDDPTAVTLAGTAGDVAEGAEKTFTVTLGRGLVNGETLAVPLTFGGDATRNTDYTTACPTSLPTGVTCNNLNTDTTPTVTFTGPTTGATATTVTLTLSAATDNTTEAGGESVVIGFGTLTATGLEGGTSTTDSLADFSITDPDSTAPTVTITGIPDKIKTTTALTATFTFSESVTGFIKDDITVTGGTPGAFAGSGSSYTLAITPTSGSDVTVTVAADSATDGTNTGPASAETATAVWDETAPTLEISGVPAKIKTTTALTATFTFSESVTGFIKDDITVTGGTAGTFGGSGATYTLAITPTSGSNVVVTVAADAATDGLNTGPASAESATATWDETAPTLGISGVPAKINDTTALTATFAFSEAVTGFEKNDITVTGGTAGAFGGSGATYTLAITPTSGSDVTVTVAANAATDGANTGPASAESATATWDASVPTVEISGVPARISGTANITATFTFSEDVTGFVKNDITVTGGTAGTFTATSATVYTLVITPDGDADVVVTVAADSATDGLNTGPASAEAATAVWTALVFSSATVTVVEESSATYTVALSSQPDASVTVTVGGASGEVTFDTDSATPGTQTTALTFSTTNWSTGQTVTVLAAADNDTANDSATLTHTASGGGYGSVSGDVEVTVTDNDTPSLVLDPTSLTVAEGGSGTYTVKLATQPTASVTVTVGGTSSTDVTVDTDGDTGGNQSTLTFTTGTWNTAQTVTVTAGEDNDNTNDEVTLTHTAANGGYGSVTGNVAVTVTDDDTAGLVLDPTSLTVAEGGSGTYTVALATQPTGTVTVTVAGASGDVTVDTNPGMNGDQSTLEFTTTTWSTAQTVTVSADEDDDTTNDSATLAHSASGGGYGSVTGSVAVTVTDDDTVPTAPAGFTAAAGNQQVVLSWTDPDNSAIDSWQFRQRTPPDTGAWGSWTAIASSTATTTTHTVTGLTNGTAYGFQVRAVAGTLQGAESSEETATPAVYTVAFASGSTAVTVAEGDNSHAELTLELSAARAAATSVRLIAVGTSASQHADFEAGPYTVNFPAGETQATLLIAIVDDNVPEESEAFNVTIVALNLPAGVSVGTPSEATVTIRDDDQPHPAPTDLTATPGAGSVALAWRYAPPAPPAVDRTADFQYRQGTGSPLSWGAWTTIPGSGAGTRSHTVKGLTGGTGYAFQVRARSRPGGRFRPGLESATARATPLASLADKVRDWMAEASCAADEACAPRWKRALKALGETDSDLADVEPMTFGEALTLAYTPGVGRSAGWLEVAKALQALELERVVITIAASPPGPVAEGAEVTFTLTAAAAPSTTFDVFVNVADAPGSDFLAAADEGQRRVTLPLGETTAGFTVRTVADSADEPDGAITATLAAVPGVYTLGSPASVSVQVTDNDGEGVVPALPVVTIAGGGAVAEGADAAFTVRRTGDTSAALTVLLAISEAAGGGRDFVAVENEGFKRVIIRAGQAEAAYAVPTVDDDVAEPRGAVTVALRADDDAYARGDPASAEVEVRDDDGEPPLPAVGISGGAGITEGAAATFTLTAVPPPAAPLPVSVAIAQTGSFAAVGEAGPRTVTVPATGTATFTVATDDDPTDEAAGAITATLAAGTGYTLATASASVAVADNDAAPATCAATAADLVATVRGYYASNRNRADRNFGENWLRVLIAFGAETSATLEPYTVAEARAGEDAWSGWRPVRIELERLENCAKLTALVFSSATVTVVEESSATYTVALSSRPDGNVTVTVGGASGEVTFDTDDDMAGTQTTALTFSTTNWSTGQTVTVLAAADNDTANDSATLTHTAAGGGYGSVTGDVEVTVTDNDTPGLVLDPTSLTVAEGGSATYTVALATQPTGTVTVTVAGASGDVTVDTDGDTGGNQNTLTFTTGTWSTAQTVTVSAGEDNDTTNDKVTLTHTAANGGYGSVTGKVAVTVTDDDAPAPITVSIDSPRVSEGETMQFTLRLSAPAPGTVFVFWRTRESSPVSATANVDYRSRQDITPFFEGEQEKQVAVPTVADAHDDGEETFEVVIYGATALSEELLKQLPKLTIDNGIVGVGTITNDDPLPAAYLARFGRTVAEQALEGIADRIGASRTPGTEGAFAGTALGASTDGEAVTGRRTAEIGREEVCVMPALGRDIAADTDDAKVSTDECAPIETRSMGEGEALLGSHFTFTRPADATGGTLAFWGRASRNTFDGAERDAGTAITLEGTVTTALLGADYARGDWLFGLALTQSTAEGSYSGGDAPGCSEAGDEGPAQCDSGAVDASLSAALPYASLHATPRLKLWGAAGLGAGEVTLKTMDRRYRADTEWTMAAAGLRGDLLDAHTGPALALTADALWTRTASERTRDLAASASNVTRLRLGVEGRYRFAFDGESQLTPTLEAGMRHDGGDAETGLGVELGGGLAWSAPTLGLTLDVSGRTLIAHEDDDLDDRGLAAALTFDPAPESERGPSLSLRQDVGDRAEGGLDALFAPDPLADRTGSTATARWTLEGAWGFSALGGRFTASPHAGLGLSPDTRETTLGWRLAPAAPAAPDLTVGVKATRREDDLDAPEHIIGFEATVRW